MRRRWLRPHPCLLMWGGLALSAGPSMAGAPVRTSVAFAEEDIVARPLTQVAVAQELAIDGAPLGIRGVRARSPDEFWVLSSKRQPELWSIRADGSAAARKLPLPASGADELFSGFDGDMWLLTRSGEVFHYHDAVWKSVCRREDLSEPRRTGPPLALALSVRSLAILVNRTHPKSRSTRVLFIHSDGTPSSVVDLQGVNALNADTDGSGGFWALVRAQTPDNVVHGGYMHIHGHRREAWVAKEAQVSGFTQVGAVNTDTWEDSPLMTSTDGGGFRIVMGSSIYEVDPSGTMKERLSLRLRKDCAPWASEAKELGRARVLYWKCNETTPRVGLPPRLRLSVYGEDGQELSSGQIPWPRWWAKEFGEDIPELVSYSRHGEVTSVAVGDRRGWLLARHAGEKFTLLYSADAPNRRSREDNSAALSLIASVPLGVASGALISDGIHGAGFWPAAAQSAAGSVVGIAATVIAATRGKSAGGFLVGLGLAPVAAGAATWATGELASGPSHNPGMGFVGAVGGALASELVYLGLTAAALWLFEDGGLRGIASAGSMGLAWGIGPSVGYQLGGGEPRATR